MDPLTRIPRTGYLPPGMSGEVEMARRAPRTRYIVAIDGVVGHVEATDHEAAAQDAAETCWLASEIRERVIVEVVEPVAAGGARHLVCVVPEIQNEGGGPLHAARSDGEPATAPPRLTPDLYGGAQSAGLTPSVRPLREAAGRPCDEQGVPS